MQNKSQKIKAFTLSELVIVMVITIIVVGLAFTVLQLVQKNIHAISTNFSNTAEVKLLEQSLWIDANRCNKIQYDESEETLAFISEMDTVTYQFEESYILKAQDTFAIALADKRFYFEGKNAQQKLTDAFKLQLTKDFQDKTIFIAKKNAADIYMNP